MPKTHKKAAVLGWPVNHSLSPRLHGYWLNKYNIDGSYEAIAAEPDKLFQVIEELADKGFSGINLTVPHKEKAVECTDMITPEALRIGAVNTIVFEDEKIIASNTDVYGFVQNLKSNGFVFQGKALVLGAGGAARAVIAGLLAEKMQVTVINRTSAKALELARQFDEKIEVRDWDYYPDAMRGISLLVNTTSLGMKGQAALAIKLDTLPKDTVVTDIVYNPLITPFLVDAKKRGNSIIDGLGMLLYQAQPAFEAFFGIKPEVTKELREHVLKGVS